MRRLILLIVTVILISGCTQPLISNSRAHQEDGVATPIEPKVEATSGGPVKKFTIRATKYHFDHEEIHVNRGDIVELTLKNEKGYHTIKIEGYNVELKPSRAVTFVASEKGEFTFRCGIVCGSGHDVMTGKLIVE